MPRNGAVSVEVAAALYAWWPGAQHIITTRKEHAVFPARVNGEFQQGHAQYGDSVLVAGVSAYYLEAAHTIVVFDLDLRRRVARLRKELA